MKSVFVRNKYITLSISFKSLRAESVNHIYCITLTVDIGDDAASIDESPVLPLRKRKAKIKSEEVAYSFAYVYVILYYNINLICIDMHSLKEQMQEVPVLL